MQITNLDRNVNTEYWHQRLKDVSIRLPPHPQHTSFCKDPKLIGSAWLLKTLVPSCHPSTTQRCFCSKLQCLASHHSHTQSQVVGKEGKHVQNRLQSQSQSLEFSASSSIVLISPPRLGADSLQGWGEGRICEAAGLPVRWGTLSGCVKRINTHMPDPSWALSCTDL